MINIKSINSINRWANHDKISVIYSPSTKHNSPKLTKGLEVHSSSHLLTRLKLRLSSKIKITMQLIAEIVHKDHRFNYHRNKKPIKRQKWPLSRVQKIIQHWRVKKVEQTNQKVRKRSTIYTPILITNKCSRSRNKKKKGRKRLLNLLEMPSFQNTPSNQSAPLTSGRKYSN